MSRIAVLLVAGLASVVLAGKATAQGAPGPRNNPLLAVFDEDRSGDLSADEIGKASAKLAALDQSKDGAVNAEELQAAMPRGRGQRGGGRGFGAPPETAAGQLQADALPQDEAEARILATLKKMWEGERYQNVSPTDGRLLRLLAETIGAQRIVEVGTSTGESGLWLSLALQSTGGKLVTHELSPERAAIARSNFKAAGVDGIVTVVEGDAHETVAQQKEPIDMVFLDADKPGYIDYLNKLLPLLRPGGLIVAHNMNPNMAQVDFVKAISEKPELETLLLLREGSGVSVTLKKR